MLTDLLQHKFWLQTNVNLFLSTQESTVFYGEHRFWTYSKQWSRLGHADSVRIIQPNIHTLFPSTFQYPLFLTSVFCALGLLWQKNARASPHHRHRPWTSPPPRATSLAARPKDCPAPEGPPPRQLIWKGYWFLLCYSGVLCPPAHSQTSETASALSQTPTLLHPGDTYCKINTFLVPSRCVFLTFRVTNS